MISVLLCPPSSFLSEFVNDVVPCWLVYGFYLSYSWPGCGPTHTIASARYHSSLSFLPFFQIWRIWMFFMQEKLFLSKNRTEASLGKKLKNDVLPEIEKVHKVVYHLLTEQGTGRHSIQHFVYHYRRYAFSCYL